MEFVSISGMDLKPYRIGLGTWATGGGWTWDGTDEEEFVSHDSGRAG